MRGKHEMQCLTRVKNLVFCKDGRPMKNPFNDKSYLNVTDEKFKEDRIWLVNPDCHKSYFGLTEQNREEFECILRKAQPNPNASRFPDFMFDNGFIEHFRVTSSVVTRKGATHTRKEQEFQSIVDTETAMLESEWNETPSFDEVRSKTWMFSNPEHSHEYLVDSFKNNWEHHIESYSKYSGARQTGIFMIEYPEVALSMCENVYHPWVNGMSHGDMREQEKFSEYRLSRDKKLLEYVYQFKDRIHYVIFVNLERVEVICTENIPYLLNLLPWDYVICPLHVATVASVRNISVPTNCTQGDENNDQT